MKLKLKLALGLIAILAGQPAQALELGALNAESALNQPFLGFIELGGVKPDELDTLRIQLAPPEAFEKAKLERYYYLTQLRFTPEATADGQVRVRVTSREPMREPYLDFLVEAIWPGGRLIKGYTVLLDPPTRIERRAPQVQTARASAVTQTTQPTTSPAAAQPKGEYLPAPGEGFPLYIGPVRPGEGLWSLARRHAPAGATAAQTALALYRCNQAAFVRGDINRLIAGKTLVIPSRDELFALDAETAWREFQAAIKGRPTQKAPLTPITAEMLARLRLVGVAAAPAPTRVPAEQTAAQPLPPAPASPPSADVLQAIEASEAARQEADELRQRIQELEKQLAEIQGQVRLRDAELARLQSVAPQPMPAGEGPAQAESQIQAPPAAPVGAGPGQAAPLPAIERPAGPPETAAQPGVLSQAPAAPQPIPPPEVGAQGVGTPGTGLIPLPEFEPKAPATAAIQPPAPPTPAPAPPPKAPAPEPQPAPSSTWHDLLLPIAGLAGLTALGILLFSLLSAHRRRAQMAEGEEEEGPPTLGGVSLDKGEAQAAGEAAPAVSLAKGAVSAEGPAQAAPAPGEPRSAKPEEEELEPVSIMTDFDVETGEADVLSEADIYIAYGRYREARDLLAKEIRRHPQRLELKYKLAEALASAGEREALEALLSEIKSLGGDTKDPAQWERLQRLWRESTPTIAAQAGTSAPASATGTRPSPGLAKTPATPTPEQTPAAQPPAGQEDLLLELSESLGLGESDESRPDEDLLRALQTAAPEPARAPAAGPGLDEELDKILPLIESGKGAELKLPELDLGPSGQPGPSLAIDSALGPERESIPSDLVSSQWQVDSGIWDEVATKLDLARAYIEMNDKEAAREILEEVLNEGREDQRKEAQSLLERLARSG